ncbi:hypothetical protein [uncultured Sulfitobacter sp.]|uniref:type I restriction endonuclease subunit R, EcoR124 family n=1 Tax=uncultured Sulfitobacter sp. TaxID=191468 RepID=UPI003443BB61
MDKVLTGAFTEFWNEERSKSVALICSEEGLDVGAFKQMIESYQFSGKPPLNDTVVKALEKPPRILERKSVAERIIAKLLSLISKFDDGLGDL